jgi:S-adenosylmethionine hydrolase
VAFQFLSFLTDYHLIDHFVGTCHGVIATIAPEARVLDLTHQVPRGDVRQGALTLAQSISYLPVAVHLAVVDPGVGTERRAVAVLAQDHVLVGPDNGLLLWAADALGGARHAYELAESAYRLRPVSATFHGRDVFAPAAAHVAAGLAPAKLGPPVDVDSLVRLPDPVCVVVGGAVHGEVIAVDTFGNAQTSVRADTLARAGIDPAGPGAHLLLSAHGHAAPQPVSYGRTFADVPPGEAVAFLDSAGQLALAVNRGEASAYFGLRVGSQVTIRQPG